MQTPSWNVDMRHMKRNLSEANRYTVVTADDNLVLRRILIRALEETKFFRVVAEASDGNQAVAMTAAHRPDLVILDLSMPGKGGLEALEAIKEASPSTFVVVFSALGPGILGRTLVDAGAHLHIEKSVLVRDLVDELLAGLAVHEAQRFKADSALAQ